MNPVLGCVTAFVIGLVIPFAARALLAAGDRHLEQLLTEAYSTDLDSEYRQLLEEDA